MFQRIFSTAQCLRAFFNLFCLCIYRTQIAWLDLQYFINVAWRKPLFLSRKIPLGVEACLIYSLEKFFPVGFPRKKRSWYIFVGFSCTQKSNKVESQWEIFLSLAVYVPIVCICSTTFFVISEKSGTFVIIFIRYNAYNVYIVQYVFSHIAYLFCH